MNQTKALRWLAVCLAVLFPQLGLGQNIPLVFRPVAAEYSQYLDRIIMISGNPNRLHIYDPAGGAAKIVDLARAPLSVSVGPDGAHAVVGHDSLLSFVNLVSGAVEKTFPITVVANNVALSISWIYVMPNSGNCISVNIGSGAVISGNTFFSGSAWRLNTAVDALYSTRDGTSPNDVERYDISTGPITRQTDSIYHGDYAACGAVFFSPSGDRIYTGCGTAFRASRDPELDMRYLTTLRGAGTMRSLSESAAIKRVAMIQNDNGYYPSYPDAPVVTDNVVLLYESDHLNQVGQFALLDFQAGSKAFKAHGRWVFFNAASTALYVVAQADVTSGFLDDFAVQVLPMTPTVPCGAAFASASTSVIGDGATAAVNILAAPNCRYDAVSSVPWIQVVSGGYGSGNGLLKYMVRANPGTVRAGTISIGDARFNITQAVASTSGDMTRLPYNVVSAAYDKPLDKLILISSNPNELHIRDAFNRSEVVVPLVMPPIGVSVRPDGLFAAVGHDGWVSYIDLQAPAVVQVFQVITDVGSLVLAGNGYMYLFPAREWSDMFSVDIAKGTVTATSAIYNGRIPRLSVDGNYLYVGGSSFSKWSIAGGPAKIVNSSFSAVATCGNLWLSEDGRRLFTGCAKAYRASSVPSEDLQPNGGFSTLQSIAWADQSAAQRKTAVIAGSQSYYSSGTGGTQIQIYGDAFLDFTGSMPVPSFTTDSSSYSGYGQFLFWNRGDDRLVVVIKADDQAKLTSSYAVSVMSPTPAGQNILTIPDRGGISRITAGPSNTSTVGWARFQPNFGSSMPAGLAIFGSRVNGVLISEATVPATQPMQDGRIYAEVSNNVNTGIAIANPNSVPAIVLFNFTDQNGVNFGSGTLTIPANGQIAGFLNQAPFYGGSSINGTFTFSCNLPLAAIALRGLINQRSEFLWTTLPVTPLNQFGGSGVFPSFADGGGWSTQFVLVNHTNFTMTGTLQFYSQGSPTAGGVPVSVTVDGQTGTAFSYSIAAGSSRKLTTSGAGPNTLVGSVRIVSNNSMPGGVAIFSAKNAAGVTISEAGVPLSSTASSVRLYAESSDDSSRVQTGIALANPLTTAMSVTLQLSTLLGVNIGPTATLSIPANGQVQMFLNQIQGFEGLPASFQGVLKISTQSYGLNVVGLRSRYNERGDYLITTTNPVTEDSSSQGNAAGLLFPHLADGAGFTTQFILFNNSSYPQTAEGTLQLYTQNGQGLNLPLR